MKEWKPFISHTSGALPGVLFYAELEVMKPGFLKASLTIQESRLYGAYEKMLIIPKIRNENLVIAYLKKIIFCGIIIFIAKLLSDAYSVKHGLKSDVATVVFTDNRKRVFKE